MKCKTVIFLFLVLNPFFLSSLQAGDEPKSFTSVELQPTVAYLKYKGNDCRMVRLLFKEGKSYEEATASVSFNGRTDQWIIPAEKEGLEVYEIPLPGPPVEKETQVTLTLQSGRQTYTARCIVAPCRKWSVYVLAHSHVDVGYTDIQPKVLKLHMDNIDEAIALAKRTMDYPVEARYKWNTEALVVVENYLAQAGDEKRQEFWDAVKKGWICLDGAYGNINTSATDPGQLMQMFYDATKLANEHGIEINTLFQGDVPGSSWGLAAQTEQTGIKYFLSGPNASDRIGQLARWQDHPFYWRSPSGKQKLLFWQCQPYSIGYGLKGRKIPNFFSVADPKPFYTGHPSENFLNPYLFEYLSTLEQKCFPYDMTILTWALSDNAPIDPELPDAVKEWNERYASPRLIITSSRQFFHDFEKKYQAEIPELSGDYTEYWTDGLGSAARETALNRNAAARLQQANAIWAIRNKAAYPTAEVDSAWKNILLFSEHTWGAYNSVENPDDPKVKAEWKIKQSFALNAQQQTDRLLEKALRPSSIPEDGSSASSIPENSIDVFNTLSWPRTDLVLLPAGLSRAGDRVLDAKGNKIPSQRLSTGELAFVADNIPALGKRRYSIQKGKPFSKQGATINTNSLSNGIYTIKIDPATGTISQLEKNGFHRNLVDPAGFNKYIYLPGDSLEKEVTSTDPKITIKENGPLVVSLLIQSSAPGANSLRSEIQLINGIDRVDISNTIDKKAIRSKESVHFAFPFNIDKGQVRYNIPWGTVNAEADQLPYANRNWYTLQRWVDISNADYGVTWSSPDAPLFEIGKITTNGLLGGLHNSPLWIKYTPQSSTLYSWVMNNLWHTNFPADQEGVVTFRYCINVHDRFDNLKANQAGLNNQRPLIVAPADRNAADGSLVKVEGNNVFVEGLRPCNNGEGWILQLVNCGEQESKVFITRPLGQSRDSAAIRRPSIRATPEISLWESNLLEDQVRPLNNGFPIPAKGILTIKVE